MSDAERPWDRPVVLDHRDDVASALDLLGQRRQAMGFVWGGDGFVGVVTVEDLRFAVDWEGPAATVDDAMTFSVVEISRDADLSGATEAFGDGLRRWVGTHGPTRTPRSGP
ncbi:MAG: hypothetical protein KF703_11945 [Actinobacteria bacterium]|nr:hypothetical protein [Actinomycetota bacterium]